MIKMECICLHKFGHLDINSAKFWILTFRIVKSICFLKYLARNIFGPPVAGKWCACTRDWSKSLMKLMVNCKAIFPIIQTPPMSQNSSQNNDHHSHQEDWSERWYPHAQLPFLLLWLPSSWRKYYNFYKDTYT